MDQVQEHMSSDGISDKPPSLNVDIRNSLILPGVSNRQRLESASRLRLLKVSMLGADSHLQAFPALFGTPTVAFHSS